MSDPLEPMRILIVDDHPFFRRGLREVLDAESDMQVVAEAGDAEHAIDLVQQLRPDRLDMILMDVDLPAINGIVATQRITGLDPDLPVVMLTVSTLDRDLFEALENGAVGYLSKTLSPDALLAALRAFRHDGALPLSRPIAQKMLGYFRARPRAPERAPTILTDREREVLELIAGGARDREIAERLVVSESTVKKHVQNILRKLHVRNRTEAVGQFREG